MKDNLVNELGDLVNDCISRQAAIDALGEKPLVWDDLSDFDLGKAAQWSDDVDAIKALPSAQPEIIRCKDCRYWDTFPSSTAAPDLHECKTGIVMHWHTKANDFCSRAKRRQDD